MNTPDDLKPIAEMICRVCDHQQLNKNYRHLVVDAPVDALTAQLSCPPITEPLVV